MKRLKIIPAILIILLLSGCMGTEPNDVAYVVAMGFDAGENDNYKITIQFAKPTQISGGASEEGGKGERIVDNITIEAPNIYSGINIANNIVSKKFSLSHAKLMVFSKEVAENGLDDIIETLARSYEIRPDMYLAVAPDGSEEYLSEVKPMLELNPAKYYQLTYEKKGGTGIPKSVTQDFYFCKSSLYRDAVLPIAGTMKTDSSSGGSGSGSESGEGGSSEESMGGMEEGGGSGGSSGESTQELQKSIDEGSEEQKSVPINEDKFEYKIKNYSAGEVAIEKENKSEAMGMALFKNNKLVGLMGGIDSEIYNILSGNYEYGYISFYSEKSPDVPVTVRLEQRKMPRISVDTKKKKIEIKLYLESDLYSLPANYITENDIEYFESNSKQYIENMCMKFLDTTINEYNVDVLGFANKAKKSFLTYSEFSEHYQNENFSDYEINVDAEFNVRHSGLIMREDSIRGIDF
ncbi:MAG: hypothetical protein LIO59_01330 [Oscillospiraceae bacterium]|nr:hypothetical protein [Oscillospiraceae bacterium]